MKHWVRTLPWLLAASSILIAATLPASAFDEDAHHDLKYALARKIGYSVNDADKIADADQAVDEDKNTKPGPGAENNKKYHAFGSKAENDARRAELEDDVKNETDRDKKLAKLGILLHFVEDIYSHQGLTAPGWESWGWVVHAIRSITGQCPDSMANDPDKTRDMTKDSLDTLFKFAPDFGVTPTPVQDILNNAQFQKMIGDIIANSSPDWYVPLQPGKKQRIINGNKGIIEDYLGEPIPEPMIIKYDHNGQPIKIGPIEYVTIDPCTYLSDLVVTNMTTYPLAPNQIMVEVDLLNCGVSSSVPGNLTVMSIDKTSYAVVGQATVSLASLAAGGTTTTPVLIVPAATTITNTYIAANVDVDDRNASNGDWVFWYGPVSAGKLSKLRLQPAGTRVIITQPKVATVSCSIFADFSWYIEEPTRASGIKVVGLSTAIEGDSVTLTGAMREDANGEKYLAVSSMDSTAYHGPLRQLGVGNRNVCAAGGLLVKGWGRVTESATGYFVMDDGGKAPVYVVFDKLLNPLGTLPGVGDYVYVIGPSGLLGMETHTVPAIRPRGESDIRMIQAH